ncbi:MAG: hypothetical protein HQL35_03960 [Alphaproteobacteria bacterium]|nr:hypothetical protein [Alphaproteobacteria bacterium]
MTIYISAIEKGALPTHLTINGITDQGWQNVHVFVATGEGREAAQSANLTAVSDADGHWSAVYPKPVVPGARITAFARSGDSPLAEFSTVA